MSDPLTDAQCKSDCQSDLQLTATKPFCELLTMSTFERIPSLPKKQRGQRVGRIDNPTYKKQRGQSMVELAVSLMVILWLLAGAIDFGIGFLSYVAIRDAAQEGATYGSLHPTDTAAIVQRVRDSSSAPVNLADASSVTVTVATAPGEACAGHPLTVTVVYDYPLMMPLIGLITGNPIHLTAKSTSTILTPACP